MPDQSPAEQLFFAALAEPPALRAAFLDAHCPDPELRARVEKLLAAQAMLGEFLADGLSAAAPTADANSPTDPAADSTADLPGRGEHLGTVLAGKYKLIEAIGEGGMGNVFLAQQLEPVKRAVAVKVIKAGLDSKAVMARFEAERQALAMMDHPNIARVLDAGTTDGGRPFFVMELVKGTPITQFCDDRKLTPKQRLELFVPVCQAIQHAHQKGVIHRDIKPSNVLVAMYDDRPVPKVIDFGVAKAAGQTLTDKTLMTGFGTVVGTPEYMSPEQASLNNMDVDTRSDVYSLGVLLYELLTGSTPVNRKALGKAALLEVLRVVREVEAPRPSSRLSTTDALPSVAANRGTEPAKLSKLIRGELDWLVLKALEKDRTRRYETANGLARDIQRYLADEVVEARPPTTSYRLRKFVRRHKGRVAAAVVLFVTLLTGVIGTTVGMLEARHQQKRAVAALSDADARRAEAETAREAEADQRQRAEQARSVAQAKEAEANAVVQFFQEKVIAAGRPKGQAGGLGRDVTLRDAIHASLPSLGTDFADQPLIEARLRRAAGSSFWFLNEFAIAAEQQERARQLYTEHRGPDHPDTLKTLHVLANSYHGMGRVAEALQLREFVANTRRRNLGPEHPMTLDSLQHLANSYMRMGRQKAAIELREQVMAVQQRVNGLDNASTLLAMGNLASGYEQHGRHAEAVQLYEATIAGQRRVHGADHPITLATIVGLADALNYLGRRQESRTLFEEVLPKLTQLHGPDHKSTLRCTSGLTACYVSLNRYADAVPLAEHLLAREIVANRAGAGVGIAFVVRAMHCRNKGDLVGCRSATERLEARKQNAALPLYYATCCRAILAAAITEAGGVDAAMQSKQEADLAMAWFEKAIRAGFKGAGRLQTDSALDVLRHRADFQKLIATIPEVAPPPRPVN